MISHSNCWQIPTLNSGPNTIMMEKTNKMSSNKADTIIDVVEIMDSLKESGEIQFVNYKWDEENSIFNINVVPKKCVEYIKVDFVVTPTGTTFN